MSNWIQKKGYATAMQAAENTLNSSGTEVHLVRFQEGKFTHYHKETTEFFYFTTGSGRVILDGKEKQLHPGVTLVIEPYVTHTFINDRNDQYLEAVLVKTNCNGDDTYQV